MKNLFLSMILLFSSISFGSNINLSDYFGKKNEFGNSTEIKLNEETIVIKEVLEGKNKVGYVGLSKSTNDVLYVVKFLKETNSIETLNVLDKSQTTFKFETEGKYIEFLNRDLITEVSKINSNSNLSIKFWGWTCGASYSLEPGSCYQNCTHHVFWMNNGTEYGVPCGTH